MELDHVEAFLAITRSGGFARGSAALHLSQPATSRRIKLLEAELGAPLFDRLGRGATLPQARRALPAPPPAPRASPPGGLDAGNALRGRGPRAGPRSSTGWRCSNSSRLRGWGPPRFCPPTAGRRRSAWPRLASAWRSFPRAAWRRNSAPEPYARSTRLP